MRNHPRVGFIPPPLTRCECAPAQRPTIIYNSPGWCELWGVGCIFTNLLLVIMCQHSLSLSPLPLSPLSLSLSIYLIMHTYLGNIPLGSAYAWHYIMWTCPRERLSCSDATCYDRTWLYVESPPFYLNTRRNEGHARLSNQMYMLTVWCKG